MKKSQTQKPVSGDLSGYDVKTDNEIFRIVSETAADAIITIDENNRILFVNRSAEMVFGLTAEEMLNQSVTMLLPERFRDKHAAGVQRFVDSGKKNFQWKGVELVGLHKSGREIPLEISYGVTKRNDRCFFTAIIRDISERKIADEVLKKSEERLRMIFEKMTDGFYVSTPAGRFVDLNPAMIKMFGYESREQMMQANIPIDLYFHPGDRISHVMDESQGVSDVYRMRRRDGSVIWVEDKGGYTYDDSGRKVQNHGLIRDVTERVLIEEALQENERMISTLMSNLPGMAYRSLSNLYWTKKFVSDGCFDLTGYTSDELIDNKNVSFADLIHPDDAGISRSVVDALAAGVPFQLNYRLITKSGTEKWVWEQGCGVYGADGDIAFIEGLIIDVTERINAENALARAESNYRNLVEMSPAIVYLAETDPPYSTIYISPNIESLGYPIEEWYQNPEMWISIIHADDKARVLKATEEARTIETETNLEYRLLARDGTVRWFHDKGRFIHDETGKKSAWQGIIIEITETKILEEQLRQSQKLESVGRLAGGIAHDFNNMLTAINGYSELTLRKLSDDDPLRVNLEEIKKAGDHSAALTQQLLAFSRRQILKPEILDLNHLVANTTRMLGRVIGEDITLNFKLSPQVGLIEADPGQINQILLNLVVNARDAMPQGGEITIETTNIQLKIETPSAETIIPAGEYVLLAVSDNGSGMDEETRHRIFEPFFTTKAVGTGTGLGLATVYGIVKQSEGFITVESELNVGTVFKIYFPCRPLNDETGDSVDRMSGEAKKTERGTGTILLVEDEPMVRNLARQSLEDCGYRVFEAESGSQALELCKGTNLKIDLLLTDVVMPKMGGRALAEKLSVRYPSLPVLFMSGYTDDEFIRQSLRGSRTEFIQKPFDLQYLVQKVREMLASPKH